MKFVEDELELVDCCADVAVKTVEQGDVEVRASNDLWSSLTNCLSIFNTDLFVFGSLLFSSS